MLCPSQELLMTFGIVLEHLPERLADLSEQTCIQSIFGHINSNPRLNGRLTNGVHGCPFTSTLRIRDVASVGTPKMLFELDGHPPARAQSVSRDREVSWMT